MEPIDSDIINKALMRLSRRAEKAAPETMVRTFVDVGPLFTLLSIEDNQVFYGRRGTGKTHALRYLAEKQRTDGHAAIYLDLTNVGSSGGIYSDQTISLTERATRLLVDVLLGIHDALVDFCVERSEEYDLSKTGPLLDQLGEAVTQVKVVGDVQKEVSQEAHLDAERKQSGIVNLSLESANAGFGAASTSRERSDISSKVTVSGRERHTVHFGSVRTVLDKLAKIVTPSRILILLDEWSSIPLELQPYLADLIRRSVFPVTECTVKIAAIEHRSVFQTATMNGDYIGIEVGADVSADINLDDFLVFDNDSVRAREFYRSMFHKHLTGSELLPEEMRGYSDTKLFGMAFTQINAFDELVRAAEGVPRDAIHISSLAAQYALKDKISVPHVRRAAKNWYQTGKESAVRTREEAIKLLHWIIDQVIGERKARAFLLQSNVRHDLVEELFDARVLHVMKHGVSTHDQPGVRYDVYKLDYGCYVELMSTVRAPIGLIPVDEEDDPSGYIEVPQDDYRSIRRAILDLSEYEKQTRNR